MATIQKSVGTGGANKTDDVVVVQDLLNRVPPSSGGPEAPLAVDGLCWHKTESAIRRFQKIGCGFQWPDGRIEPGRRTWNELAKYDTPAPVVLPPEQPKCGASAAAGFAPTSSQMNFFVGKYAPIPLDAFQRSVARGVFGTSIDLDAVRVVYRKPPGAWGLCIVGPLPGQNLIFLGSTAKELLIHELAHVWQSQHHDAAGKYMWNSERSQKMADGVTTSAYDYVPKKPFGDYAAEQIAEQVEAGEKDVIDHVRSRHLYFKDPLNKLSLATPRVQMRTAPGVKRAPRKY